MAQWLQDCLSNARIAVEIRFCGPCAGSHAPDVLQERIEAFLQGFAETLASMAPEELEKQRAAIIAAKLQACDALFDETEEHWQHICNRK